MRTRLTPFARAALTYWLLSSSIIAERTTIVSRPIAGSASVIAGKMRCVHGPSPNWTMLELDARDQQDHLADEELRCRQPDEAERDERLVEQVPRVAGRRSRRAGSM